MNRIIKLLAALEAPDDDTATNVSLASLVRVCNINNTNQVQIIQKNVGGDVLGSITVEFQKEIFIQKAPTDTLGIVDGEGGAEDIAFTSVAFT